MKEKQKEEKRLISFDETTMLEYVRGWLLRVGHNKKVTRTKTKYIELHAEENEGRRRGGKRREESRTNGFST